MLFVGVQVLMSACVHHWTVTSECPSCLRAELNEAQKTLAEWGVRREAERSAERKNFDVIEKMRQDTALRLEECTRQHAEAVAELTLLREAHLSAAARCLRAEAERDAEIAKHLKHVQSCPPAHVVQPDAWEIGTLRGELETAQSEGRRMSMELIKERDEARRLHGAAETELGMQDAEIIVLKAQVARLRKTLSNMKKLFGWFWDEGMLDLHDEDCPHDDTCECDAAEQFNEAHADAHAVLKETE